MLIEGLSIEEQNELKVILLLSGMLKEMKEKDADAEKAILNTAMNICKVFESWRTQVVTKDP